MKLWLMIGRCDGWMGLLRGGALRGSSAVSISSSGTQLFANKSARLPQRSEQLHTAPEYALLFIHSKYDKIPKLNVSEQWKKIDLWPLRRS